MCFNVCQSWGFKKREVGERKYVFYMTKVHGLFDFGIGNNDSTVTDSVEE